MSKSKGNVVTPEDIIDDFSADGVRYWAARARLGTDTAYDPGVFKVGKRLVTKVFNASRFVLMQMERAIGDGELPGPEHISEKLDLAFVNRLRTVIEQATDAHAIFDYAAALQITEEAFWWFCDHYLELVKLRSYSDEDTPERRSAIATLGWGLDAFLRMLAPFLPYVTEEVWSWRFSGDDGRRSVHSSQWPSSDEIAAVPYPEVRGGFDAAVEVMTKIRGAKTTAQKSLRWPVSRLEIVGSQENRDALALVLDDVLRAGNVEEGATTVTDGDAPEGERFTITIELSETME
jgi:valyl-tRNA synthetase